ncbi:MAG: hypothetical protein AUI93_04290 [Crenarchaeota archaeon 13_1_40CM_3_52_10]|nr:MAG: hypothetical protein AUI93_04290 [Crenarchaeota archaeon 13_1_40CM_3_52_10]
MASISSLGHHGDDQRKAKMTILFFMLLLATLVVETVLSPFVVTVYSKGCWTATSGGVFQRVSVSGCGSGSWVMFDIYAVVHPRAISGSNDLSVVLTSGTGLGGSCLGGSECAMINLFLYTPPSPVTCQGCIISVGPPNPVGDWFGSYSSTLGTFPDLLGVILLVYLARSLGGVPRIYRSYLSGERERASWKALAEGEKILTVFSLGFLGFRSYQLVATILYFYVAPIPTLGFAFEDVVSVMAAVWLLHYIRWKFPLKTLPSTVTETSGGGGSITSVSQPMSPSSLQTRTSSHRTLILVIILSALIVAVIIVPRIVF